MQEGRRGSAYFLRLVGMDQKPVASPKRGKRDTFQENSHDLLNEARRIEITYGLNAYSTFLRHHGHRPDRGQAATIGKLLGWRVKASDGSMQPPLTEADKAARRAVRQRRKEWAQRSNRIDRLKAALSILSSASDSPEHVIEYASHILSDETYREQIGLALTWLSRFAQEGHRYEQIESTENSHRTSCNHIGLTK